MGAAGQSSRRAARGQDRAIESLRNTAPRTAPPIRRLGRSLWKTREISPRPAGTSTQARRAAYWDAAVSPGRMNGVAMGQSGGERASRAGRPGDAGRRLSLLSRHARLFRRRDASRPFGGGRASGATTSAFRTSSPPRWTTRRGRSATRTPASGCSRWRSCAASVRDGWRKSGAPIFSASTSSFAPSASTARRRRASPRFRPGRKSASWPMPTASTPSSTAIRMRSRPSSSSPAITPSRGSPPTRSSSRSSRPISCRRASGSSSCAPGCSRSSDPIRRTGSFRPPSPASRSPRCLRSAKSTRSAKASTTRSAL